MVNDKYQKSTKDYPMVLFSIRERRKDIHTDVLFLNQQLVPPGGSSQNCTDDTAQSRKKASKKDIPSDVLFLNQQLPILPGRFQPSTFGVCELNYRVRHGYGCILTAVATESLRACTLKTVQKKYRRLFASPVVLFREI